MRYIILILCFASIGFISGCNTEASSVLHDTPQKNLFFQIPNIKFTIDAIDKDKFVVTREPATGAVLSNKYILEKLLKKYKDEMNINFRVLVARHRYSGNQMEDYTKAFNVITDSNNSSKDKDEKCILIIYFKEEKRIYIYPSISYQKLLNFSYLDTLLVRNFIDVRYPDEYISIGHLCADLFKTLDSNYNVDVKKTYVPTDRYWGYLRININGKKYDSYEPPSPSRTSYPKGQYNLRNATESGNLRVDFTTNLDGTIKYVNYTLKGSFLNEEYLKKTLSDWSFIPAMKNGVPCEGVISLNFDWFDNSESLRDQNAGRWASGTTIQRPAAKPYLDGISDPDQIPVCTIQVHPKIPDIMRSKGVLGKFIVRYVVNEKGDVEDSIVTSASYWIRDSNGQEKAFIIENLDMNKFKIGEANFSNAISRWKFRPGMKDGAPVRVVMSTPIVTTIGEDFP